MKLPMMFSLICFNLSFLIAMEKPEAPQAKQPLWTEIDFEKWLDKDIQKQKTKEEIQELTNKAESGDAESQINLAYALYGQRKIKDALMWLKRAQALGYEASSFIANLYLTLNDLKHAEEYAEKAASQNKSGGFQLLGTIKIAEGDYASALELYTKAIQLGSTLAYYSRAMLYMDQNKADLSKKDLLEIIQRNSAFKDIAKGFINLLNNKFTDAIFIFRTQNFLPGLFFAYEKMSDCELKATVENIIKHRAPTQASDEYHFGLIALRENQNEKAIAYFRKSLKFPTNFWQEPSYPGNASYYLYKLYHKSNPEEAREYLIDAAKFGQPRAALKLGIEYYRNRDLPKEKRLELAKKYLQIAADKGELAAIYNLARLAEYEKDYAKARELFGQLIKDQYLDAEKRLREMIKKQVEALKK